MNWNSASEAGPSEDGLQAATGTNHHKEKVSTRALADFASVLASSDLRLHFGTFRNTHTSTAFPFCWLIAWHVTHVSTDGQLQQDLEPGALHEIYLGLRGDGSLSNVANTCI